ncbi:ABC transporter permease [Ilumatobacter nonamiensis]|uniref:ABC transporter permease n=1 Tax=Ilumatobacter nonamiensis TaxID=467093 RepID=UPI00034B6BAA|nr:ABC transporter permease [Ilumatobacter nonamiensis]
MWRIIRNGIWSHKRRLLATTTAVLLGVAFLTASLTVGSTMTAGFDDLFSEANAGTAVVVRNDTVFGSGDTLTRDGIDASIESRIASTEGVAAVEPIVEGYGQIVGADGDAIGGDGPPTTATNWVGDSPVNPWSLADGRAPRDVATGEPYEVVIDRASADTGELAIGDRTTINAPQPVDVTVVGIATFGGADSAGPATHAAFTDAVAISLVGEPGEWSTFRVAAETGIGEDELRDAIAATLPSGIEAVTGTELTAEMMADIQSDFLAMFRTIMVAFAVIALVVAGFSIHNTFSILVAQRTRESALLRAIGASRRQVLSSIVVEALVIGIVASAAGLAVGSGLALGLKTLMDNAGLDVGIDGIVVTSTTVLISVAVGIGATVLASLLPALRASKVAPLAALRDSAVDSSANSKIRLLAGAAIGAVGIAVVATATGARQPLTQAGIGALATLVGAVVLGPVVARPAAAVLGLGPAVLRGQNGRLARRNAMRDPKRTAGSASALMVGTAVVALFTTFGASIKASVDDTVNQNFGGDLVLVPDQFGQAGLSPAVAAEVARLPEVEIAAGMSNAVVVADGETIDPSVIDPSSLDDLLDIGVMSGSLDDVTAGHLAISTGYAEDRALDIDSEVLVEYADGGSEVLTVSALYDNTMNVGDVIMTPEDWAPHADQPSDVVVLIDLADGVSEADGQAAVNTVAARNGAPDAQTRSEYIDGLGSEIDQMLFFVYGMLGLAILIALMGIANTLSLSIHERTRELGLLRAVGQTRSQVRATVRWESVIVAVFGTIGGVGLGTFLGWGLMRALGAQEGFGGFAVPTTSLAIVVVLAALAGVAAAWRPARRAGRLDILTAIATD